MRFKFPEGYMSLVDKEPATITINGREFSSDEFADLISPRPGERVTEHARRVASALGVGVVISSFHP